MGQRQDLHSLLKTILGSDKVYFQPPSGLQISYPCIIYGVDNVESRFADNYPYLRTKRYQVTVITRDPDSALFEKVGELPLCSFERSYSSDNLNHQIYNLYF